MTTAKCAVIAATIALFSPTALAGFSLDNYQLVGTYDLPALQASEASAVTWDAASDTLFVLGDEGDYLVQVDKQGSMIGAMNLFAFDDTEGLTALGGGQFVLVEERLQNAYLFNYTVGGAVSRNGLQRVSIGETIGNTGLEGISYDAANGHFVIVKEKVPQAIYDAELDFATGTLTSLTELAPPDTLFSQILGTADLSGVQVLSGVSTLLGTSDADNLLVYSQESARLMEITRSGDVLSSMDFSSVAGDIEGLSIDAGGTIYLVGETPRLYVLAAVPEPESYAMFLAGLGLLGAFARRQRNQNA